MRIRSPLGSGPEPQRIRSRLAKKPGSTPFERHAPFESWILARRSCQELGFLKFYLLQIHLGLVNISSNSCKNYRYSSSVE
ncbi:hypothetical protein LWI29_033307 [Acer saccharum]|uniref:Uncharacterized protein n=1 Tax=Acer saccharum TaxID=4024 RepID=A0AA39S8A4_ACESA|nr:hypothetical protein LWI29_033307 [Acer saccharum]